MHRRFIRCVGAFLLLECCLGASAQRPGIFSTTDTVGRHGTNRTVTPVNQVLTPYGTQVELPELRPQAIALSPDGKLLATSGKTSEVVIVDAETGRIRQHVKMPSNDDTDPEPDVVSG